MGVMTVPDVWSSQNRILTVEDMENMPDDEFRNEQAAHVTGHEEYRAAAPFAVSIVPAALVRVG
jgi:hypothetical protein